MKKLFAFILIISLILPSVVFAEIDLSGMSYDELAELRRHVNREMMSRDEHKHITVPSGVYEIGVDIPAGHWTILPWPGTHVYILYASALDETGADVNYEKVLYSSYLSGKDDEDPQMTHQIDIKLKEGNFLSINGQVAFTQFAGKPDLGF